MQTELYQNTYVTGEIILRNLISRFIRIKCKMFHPDYALANHVIAFSTDTNLSTVYAGSPAWVTHCVFYAAFLIMIKLDFVIANVVRVGSILREAHLRGRIENDKIERSAYVRRAVNLKKELVLRLVYTVDRNLRCQSI